MTGRIKTYSRTIMPSVGDKIEFLDWAEIEGIGWARVKRTGTVENFRQSSYSYYVKTKYSHTWVDPSNITAIITEED